MVQLAWSRLGSLVRRRSPDCHGRMTARREFLHALQRLEVRPKRWSSYRKVHRSRHRPMLEPKAACDRQVSGNHARRLKQSLLSRQFGRSGASARARRTPLHQQGAHWKSAETFGWSLLSVDATDLEWLEVVRKSLTCLQSLELLGSCFAVYASSFLEREERSQVRLRDPRHLRKPHQ